MCVRVCMYMVYYIHVYSCRRRWRLTRGKMHVVMPLIFHLIPSDSSLHDDDPSNPCPSYSNCTRSAHVSHTYIYIIHSDFYLISKLFCNAHGVRVTALLYSSYTHTHTHSHTHTVYLVSAAERLVMSHYRIFSCHHCRRCT
jgi:hypothetical protein